MEDRSLRVRVTGPLERFAKGFRAELAEQGDKAWSAKHQLHLVAHLSRWLASQHLEAGELVPERVEQFLAARGAAGYTSHLTLRGLSPRRCRITLGLRMSADQEDGHQQAGQSVDRREEHELAR